MCRCSINFRKSRYWGSLAWQCYDFLFLFAAIIVDFYGWTKILLFYWNRWVVIQAEISFKERVMRLHALDHFLPLFVGNSRPLNFSNLLTVNFLGNHSFVKFLVNWASLRFESAPIIFDDFQPIESIVISVNLALHFLDVYFFCVLLYSCEVDLLALIYLR